MEKEFGSSALADDDLLNCFTWAAGEPGENSPSSAAAGSSTSFLKDSPRRGGGGGRGAGGAGFDTVFDPTGAEDGEVPAERSPDPTPPAPPRRALGRRHHHPAAASIRFPASSCHRRRCGAPRRTNT